MELTTILLEKITAFLNKGNKRSSLFKKNIALSLGLKSIGLFTTFFLVSLSIKYLGVINYGVWITISGMIAWGSNFDFGFSHGLRNRLTETLAKEDYIKGRFLVSSTYLFMVIISSILFIVFLPILLIINWKLLLSLPSGYDLELLQYSITIIFIFFIFEFFLKPLDALLQAHQWPAIAQALGTIGGVITVFVVYFLNYFQFTPELFFYAISASGIPAVISLLATIYLFLKKYPALRPSFHFVKMKYIKSIGGLGTAFFLIQLSLLVVYSSDNLIISYLFGPQEVTTYNVVYRYFSIITIFFGAVMSPLWSAITDAYTRGEMGWIRKAIRTSLYILIVGAGMSLLLFLIAPPVFEWWIYEGFISPSLLTGLMAVYAVTMGWLNIFSFFVNGIGKIRLVLIAYLVAAFINIPLSYVFGKIWGLGSSGVIMATIFCMIFINILLTIQYFKVINNKAKGIWLK